MPILKLTVRNEEAAIDLFEDKNIRIGRFAEEIYDENVYGKYTVCDMKIK